MDRTLPKAPPFVPASTQHRNINILNPIHRARGRRNYDASRLAMPVTDEDAAIQAITTFTSPTWEQLDTKAKIDHILDSDDPSIDIHDLFGLYDILYFRSLLKPRVEVFWSPRLTLYRTHIWQCDGPCKSQPPFFGLVKRSMNRPPGKSDTWWSKHQEECVGTFTKIAEPEMTKEQVEKLSSLKRAGLQKNKIDSWVSKSNAEADAKAKRRLSLTSSEEESKKRLREQQTSCPICEETVAFEEINAHLDTTHPP
ncbi:SprT-like domain-containing protein Spartan [Pseudocercospora fuligena]|uniref:SprT-like domain-containing protein Spartan n=1 Tax=Pseudocercospora fuligena TaxID=685502 RepID=A0A8H6RNF6_9PEZI|nr:SprT-like domain-containing protein Spartan [Pseudocercospora fuligena]